MLTSLTSGVPVILSGDAKMPDIRKTICITGHRDDKMPVYKCDKRYRELTIAAVRLMIYRYIDMAEEAGYENFLCGLASGTDVWAGSYIVRKRQNGKKIRLFGVMPYLRHAERFSAANLALLNSIEREAEFVTVTNSNPDIVYAFGENSDAASGSLYRDRNYFMVDNSSAAIAFLNAGERSGTWQNVRYACRTGRKVKSFSSTDIFHIIDICNGDLNAVGHYIAGLENAFDSLF